MDRLEETAKIQFHRIENTQTYLVTKHGATLPANDLGADPRLTAKLTIRVKQAPLGDFLGTVTVDLKNVSVREILSVVSEVVRPATPPSRGGA